MSQPLTNLLISDILNKAEAEIAAAERDIQKWKQSKFTKNQKNSSITELKTDLIHKPKLEEYSLHQSKTSSPEALTQIEKRLRDLEISREVESEENLKKISKLEKIVDEIVEKSISPKKNTPKVKSHKSIRAKSNANLKIEKLKTAKNSRLCVYVKELEENAEKWKSRATVLQKKCYSEIKNIRKQMSSMKSEIKKEAEDIRDYCNRIINTRHED